MWLTKLIWGWYDWLDRHVDSRILDGGIALIAIIGLYICVNNALHGK